MLRPYGKRERTAREVKNLRIDTPLPAPYTRRPEFSMS
jgi:hypothetical protein